MRTGVAARLVARPPWIAAAASFVVLLAVYLATLAPGVTLWDAGELIAAVRGLGVPHPPGTPLFVVVGRAWSLALPWAPTAVATNLLSAAATAGACAALAALLARWLRAPLAAVGGACAAGLMATVWRNATETEVYALALLLAALTLLAAERAGRDDDARADALVAYLLALAVPLHLFTLVAAPAALVLAGTAADGRALRRSLVLLGGAMVAAVGAGTVRPLLALLGVGAMLLSPLASRRADEPRGRRRWAATLLAVAGVAVALSAVVVLLARARHEPPLNQGNPSDWGALLDVLARRQYAVAPLWPRQAPLWLQLANVLEYADWQVALGLAPEPPPSWGRTGATMLFAALGVHGARVHRRADRRSWRALAVLLGAASVGVVLYLNLKAGPSFGAGILPDDAPREARERDYFFTFAFWTWGAWAGVGAVALAGRLAPRRAWSGLAVVVLPLALNWRAVDRARGPDATVAADVARTLLVPAPRGAVLLSAGDNDTYPLWYLQQVEGTRQDVAVVVTSLLPAAWYRAELARRYGLGAEVTGHDWLGMGRVLRTLAADARGAGRPVLASVLLPARTRAEIGGAWTLRGPWYELTGDGAGEPAELLPATAADDSAARWAARLARPQVGDGVSPPDTWDPATRALRRALSCAPLLARADEAGRALLAARCNRR